MMYGRELNLDFAMCVFSYNNLGHQYLENLASGILTYMVIIEDALYWCLYLELKW